MNAIDPLGLFDPIGATLGAVGVVTGVPIAVTGALTAVVGAATGDPVLAGAGIGVEALGARNVIDGASLINDSFSGDHSPTVLQQIGGAVNGNKGADVGGRLDNIIDIITITHAGAELVSGEHLITPVTDIVTSTYSLTHGEHGGGGAVGNIFSCH